MISRPPYLLKRCFPGIIWHKERHEKNIFITFDDGPKPHTTPWILDTLSACNVKATFFCLGEHARLHPDLIKKIQQEGHALGNHGFSHLDGWKVPTNRYIENVMKASEFIPSCLFRPPYGRLKLQPYFQLKQKFKIIMWELLVEDYRKSLPIEKTISKIKREARNGMIIVFHDTIKAHENLRMLLPETVIYFQDKGFHLRPLI